MLGMAFVKVTSGPKPLVAGWTYIPKPSKYPLGAQLLAKIMSRPNKRQREKMRDNYKAKFCDMYSVAFPQNIHNVNRCEGKKGELAKPFYKQLDSMLRKAIAEYR